MENGDGIDKMGNVISEIILRFLVFGFVLGSSFVSRLEEDIRSLFIKFVVDIELERMVNVIDDKNMFWNDLDMLEC